MKKIQFSPHFLTSSQSVRPGWKRTNIRSKWMFTFLFVCCLRSCFYFDLFHSEQDERASCFVFVVPAAASGCLSLPRPSEFIAVAFSARRQRNGRRMNGPWGWKCAGRHSYRRVQSTVSYIGVIVFLSASISSYVTCWERRVIPCQPVRLSGGTQAHLLPYAFSLKVGNVELFFLRSQPRFFCL